MRNALLLGMMLWGVAGCQVNVDAEPVNLAAEAVISASSTYCGGSAFDCYAASRINDGDADTSLGGEYSWANDVGVAMPQWVELDTIIFTQLSKMLTQNGDPAATMAAMQEQMTQAMG